MIYLRKNNRDYLINDFLLIERVKNNVVIYLTRYDTQDSIVIEYKDEQEAEKKCKNLSSYHDATKVRDTKIGKMHLKSSINLTPGGKQQNEDET